MARAARRRCAGRVEEVGVNVGVKTSRIPSRPTSAHEQPSKSRCPSASCAAAPEPGRHLAEAHHTACSAPPPQRTSRGANGICEHHHPAPPDVEKKNSRNVRRCAPAKPQWSSWRRAREFDESRTEPKANEVATASCSRAAIGHTCALHTWAPADLSSPFGQGRGNSRPSIAEAQPYAAHHECQNPSGGRGPAPPRRAPRRRIAGRC